MSTKMPFCYLHTYSDLYRSSISETVHRILWPQVGSGSSCAGKWKGNAKSDGLKLHLIGKPFISEGLEVILCFDSHVRGLAMILCEHVLSSRKGVTAVTWWHFFNLLASAKIQYCTFKETSHYLTRQQSQHEGIQGGKEEWVIFKSMPSHCTVPSKVRRTQQFQSISVLPEKYRWFECTVHFPFSGTSWPTEAHVPFAIGRTEGQNQQYLLIQLGTKHFGTSLQEARKTFLLSFHLSAEFPFFGLPRYRIPPELGHIH